MRAVLVLLVLCCSIGFTQSLRLNRKVQATKAVLQALGNLDKCVTPDKLFNDCAGAARTYAISDITATGCAKYDYKGGSGGKPATSDLCYGKSVDSSKAHSVAFGTTPDPSSPTILGMGKDIETFLTAKGETKPTFGKPKKYWRLWTDDAGDKWDACVNLRFILCTAAGHLPNSNGEIVIATAISGVDGHLWGNPANKCSVTGNELCYLKQVCKTALQNPAPFKCNLDATKVK